MGQDFRAIFGHDLAESDLPVLSATLDILTRDLVHYLEQLRLDTVSYPSPPSGWRWGWSPSNEPDLERWSKGESLSLSGIGSMMLNLGRHSVSFACWIRWTEFVSNKATQEAIREIVFRFASQFRSPLAIYVPDSNSAAGEGAQNRVHDGAHLTDIIKYLAAQQPAATSIDSILKSITTSVQGKIYETIDCDGYYIDRFEDLKPIPIMRLR